MNDDRISPLGSYIHGKREAKPDLGLPETPGSPDIETTETAPSTEDQLIADTENFTPLARVWYNATIAAEDNAKARDLSKGITSPLTEDQLIADTENFTPHAKDWYNATDRPKRLETDEEIGRWAIDSAAAYNNSLGAMIIDWSVMGKQDVKSVQAMMKVIDAYDQTPTTAKQVYRGALFAAGDPFSWVGIGLLAKLGGGSAARGVVKNTAKTYIGKQLARAASKPALVAGTEGAAFGGAIGGVDESLRAKSEERDFDWTVPAYWAAGGAAIGAGIGGLIPLAQKYGPKAIEGLRQTFSGWTGGGSKTTLTDSKSVADFHGDAREVAFEAYNPAVLPEKMSIDDFADHIGLDEDETQRIVDAYRVSIGGREPNTLDPSLAPLPEAVNLPGSGIGQAPTLPGVGIGQAPTLPAVRKLRTQEETSSITGEPVKFPDETPTEVQQAPIKIDNVGMFSQVEATILGDAIPQWKNTSGAGAVGKTTTPVTGQELWSKISKAPGVKKEELEWLGLEKYLGEDPKKKFTQEEVQQYVQEHMVRVEQVTAKKMPTSQEDFLNDQFSIFDASLNTHWGDLVVAGERSNYRELKLTLPDNKGEFNVATHKFPENNIVSFIRTTDRSLPTTPGGMPVKTLMLEETQSDMHQQGSKKGYKKGVESSVLRDRQEKAQLDLKNGEEVNTLISELDLDGVLTDEIDANLSSDLVTRRNNLRRSNFRKAVVDILSMNPSKRMGKIDDKIDLIGYDMDILSRHLEQWQSDVKELNDLANILDDGAVRLPSTTGELAEHAIDSGEIMIALYERMKEKILEGGDSLNRASKVALAAKKADSNLNAEYMGIDDAPFKGEAWLRLSMARAIIQAKDEGYDAIAWPNANVLSDRYSKAYEKAYKNQYNQKQNSIAKKLTGNKAEQMSMSKKSIKDGYSAGNDSDLGYWSISLTGPKVDEIGKKGISQFSMPGMAAAALAEREEQKEVEL